MESLPSITGDTPEAAPRPAGPLREAQSRWLLEFERAQLARQSRQPRPSVPAAPAADAFEPPPRARAASTPMTPEARRGERATLEQRAARPSSLVRDIQAAAHVRAKGFQNTPGGGEARVARDDFSKATVTRPPQQPQRPVPVTWPRVNVHAQWNGAGVEIWVRDASLDESGRRRLAARLRAQLRGLDRLTVNGEAIYQEERTSWPSKR
jgi:hypothetical protein